jgi:dTDP-4-amino-4,6-dideoxygalactose transaminase
LPHPPLPLFDLARQWPDLREDALDAFERVAAEGSFSLGEELAAFESEYAAFCGSAHCVGVANGTAALELALRAVGVEPGMEVITVSHTFVATAEAVRAAGARPVLVDVDPSTRCLDPDLLEGALTARTGAVIAVHLYGRPAPLDGISALCRTAQVPLVEDAAQAHGGLWNGRKVGTFGAAGCFSFYPTKNLGAMGDGGAVVTDEEEVAATVRSLRHHGSAPNDPNRHQRVGRTERLDNLQAAILRLKLRALEAHNDHRRWAASQYRERLEGLPLDLPPEDAPEGRAVHHLFVIELDERDGVREALRQRGILTGIHYPTPIHLQPAFADLGYVEGDLPVTERLARRILSLPLFPGIEEHEIVRVVDALRECL